MGAHRKKSDFPFNPDHVRKKIQATLLVKRLEDHIFNGLELSFSQVHAINILLKKCVPDLTRTVVTADVNVRYVVELPKMLTHEEWLRKYGADHLDLKAEPLQITNGGGTGKLQ